MTDCYQDDQQHFIKVNQTENMNIEKLAEFYEVTCDYILMEFFV